MTTLRARQKSDRGSRIVASAKTLFRKKGYEKTTIASIAVSAGVSGVTVHNYYGTKGGILLALVIESDSKLIERLMQVLPERPDSVTGLTVSFARHVMDHAITTLEKDIWRQVIAAVTTEAGTQLREAYLRLDDQLAQVLVGRLQAMQAAGLLAPQVNAADLGRALFQLQNARFIEFISSDAMTQDLVAARLHSDLDALFSVCILPAATA